MKKNLIALTIGILLSITTVISQTAANNTGYNSVLWEISGNNLQKSSYLFGTIHLMPESEYKFDNSLKEKFETCKMLVLETEIDMPLKQQIELVKKIILPKGKKLSDYMTPEQFADYKSYLLDTLNIKKGTFNKMEKIKPIFSSVLVLNELIEKPLSYEKEFSKEAKKRKMEILGLETIEFQMGLMDSISVERQVEMLLKDDIHSNPLIEYNKLLDAYKQQDLEKLYNFAKEDDDFKYFEEDLLVNRNIKWTASLKKTMNEQSAFIAVGAAHLYGEQGMVSLLRKEGYTVKAIK